MTAAEAKAPTVEFAASFIADLERAVMNRSGRQRGEEIKFRCPLEGHEDNIPSASWNMRNHTWYCHACKVGGGALDLAERLGVEKPERSAGPTPVPPRKIVAAYDYRAADGSVIFQVVRYVPKGFGQRQPNGQGGWDYTLKGVTPVLYNLPDILGSDDMVVVTEGEKDVDRLQSLGLVATTNPGGAGKWRPQYTEALRGREVVLLPHNDEPGRKHMENVAAQLHAAGCSVTLVEIPGLPEKGDISDWLDLGLTDDDLAELIRLTPAWTPADPEKDSAAYKEDVAAERNQLFITARELAAQTPAITRWIAKPWVAENAITELSGKIKSGGKTTWVLAMCRAICEGNDFMAIPTTKGAVVFLTEQPAPSFREALSRAGLLEQDDFHILQWHKTSGLAWDYVVLLARQYAVDVGAVLLVVDTLAQFAGLKGDTENNAGAALEALAPLQLAIADGLSVLLTRHDRKGGGEVGDSARGSSAFGGVVDVVLQIQRGEGNTRPTIRVINALSRFDATPDQLMIELTESGYVALGDKSAVASDEAHDAIRKTAPTSEAEAMTEREILDAADVKRTVGQEVLRSLVEAGILTRIGEGKRGSPYRYWKPSEKDSAGTPVDAAESNEVIFTEPGEQEEFLSAASTPLRPAERNSPDWGDPTTVEGEAGNDHFTS